MKSLEHLIRDIREGKCECEKKKDSLEHTIRKVAKKQYESSYGAKDIKPVEEDVGGLIGSGTGGEPKHHAEDGKKKKTDEAVGIIGTDKYQGSEFKSIRTATPHIKPPAGEESHSQAPENASRQRTIAKEKAGINRVEEEIVEAEVKFKEKTSSTFKPAPVAPEATKSTALTTTTPKSVTTTPTSAASKAATSTVGKTVANIGKLVGGKAATALGLVVDPDFGGLLPSKGETKSEFERQKEYSDKAKTAAAEKPVELPKIDVKAAPVEQPKETPKVAAPAAPEVKSATPTPETKPEKPKAVAAAGGASVPHDAAYDVLHRVPVKTQSHLAKRHRVHEDTKERETIENMPRKGDRKSIEYVGRKDSDAKSTKEKTSRLATIKNVIDEAKKSLQAKQIKAEDGKTRAYDYGEDLLVINPDQRKIDLDVDNNEKVAKDYDNK